MKKTVSVSLSYDTVERAEQYRIEHRLASRSAAITDLIWNASVKHSQARGQMTMDEILDADKKRNARKCKKTR